MSLLYASPRGWSSAFLGIIRLSQRRIKGITRLSKRHAKTESWESSSYEQSEFTPDQSLYHRLTVSPETPISLDITTNVALVLARKYAPRSRNPAFSRADDITLVGDLVSSLVSALIASSYDFSI
jgi:hypothetical protein